MGNPFGVCCGEETIIISSDISQVIVKKLATRRRILKYIGYRQKLRRKE